MSTASAKREIITSDIKHYSFGILKGLGFSEGFCTGNKISDNYEWFLYLKFSIEWKVHLITEEIINRAIWFGIKTISIDIWSINNFEER